MATGFAAPVEGIYCDSGNILTPGSDGTIKATDILAGGGGVTETSLTAVKGELEGRIKVTEDILAGDWGGKTVKQTIDNTAKTVADVATDVYGAIGSLDLQMDAAESAIRSNIEVTIPNVYKTITDLETAENGKIAGLDGRVTDAEKAIDNLVDTKANTDMDNLTATGKTVVKDLAKGAINVVGDDPISVAKSDVDGVDTYTVSVKTDGKVESGDTGIVTGDTVYNETRVAADGNYVKASNSVGDNLSALDTELAALTVRTGAGLDEVSHRIDNVDSKINKVGAGAAALAALHPMDTDGKFSMAAGFGNYRDANAMALGLFYRPTDQVMFSMGGSMGNGENLLNVGVSFALDKGVSTSKAAMARKIAAQDEKITSLEGQNARQAAEIAALKEALSRLEAKIGK
ncbi:YadA C-terminal domain-containing protein [Succiniclasticum ruminis]|uniref:YadA-like C-terminal region n=1 Tax=Succiniclasticum ruminis DSM 9236 TaxID=1123323 RepID=A0A1I2BR21_9FIRM|nr:YadA C-terminal domain-containing protein [Succiniclasticum ruminis]SFE57700.1 YadA-like C-terminal region [Succiniclasticum ruminis DSM 9236]